MEPQLIESKALDNGLTLEIWDASRKVATDRWLVKLIACMEIEVSERWFGKTEPPAAVERMRSKLGDTRRFEYQTERNFIDQREKPLILEQMQAGLKSKIPYYSHPDFAGRFLTKEYADRRHDPDPE